MWIDYNLDIDGLNKEDLDEVKQIIKAAEHKNKTPPLNNISIGKHIINKW